MPKTINRELPIKRHAKVVAAIDLPGVPEGTAGKVRVSNGFSWNRYWVSFENGVDLGGVSHEHLAHRRDWPQFRIDREDEKSASDLSGIAYTTKSDSDADSSSETNKFGVPEHLLERSRLARQRLSA